MDIRILPPQAFDKFSRLPEGLPPLEGLFPARMRPLEVEIGCGKGRFLLARAQAFPEINFLGIDYAAKWMNIGLHRGQKRGLENLKFVRANAALMVEKYIPDGKVSVFHIYFPDPWHKRRHRKRRLLTKSFFECLWRRLAPDGLVEIATDNADYYASIAAEAALTRSLWSSVRESVNRRLFGEEMKTNYELKYEAEGRPLYYMEMKK